MTKEEKIKISGKNTLDNCNYCENGNKLMCDDRCKLKLNSLPIPHMHECSKCNRTLEVKQITLII